MSLSKRDLLAGMVASLTVGAANAQGSRRPPNVVVVLADDMGYGDLSLHGAPTINTPNIDRLAHEGWSSHPSIPLRSAPRPAACC